MAGTISSSSLIEEEQKMIFAQQELTREAEARRRREDERLAQDTKSRLEAELKQKGSEADREAERRHLEELVAKQTKVLEDKLTALAATMSPKPGMGIDPDATQVQTGSPSVGANSFSGTIAQSFPNVDVSLAPPRKKSMLPLILVIGVVLLIGAGIGAFVLLRPKPVVTAGPGPTDPNGPEAPIKPELVDLPAGQFQMGRNGSLPQEGPAHQVDVNGFSMDKTEVTNAAYAQFVREANHPPPEQWGGIKPPVGEESLPVSNITFDDAVAFAAWRSKRDGGTYRLPTEEEWEYAARNGDKDNLFPWGNTWQTGRAATQEAGVGRAQAVGSYREGGNRWGIQDLMGNVWEWTSSKASVYKGNPAQLPEQLKDWIVVRGGSFQSQAKGERPVSGTLRDWVAPNYKNITLGFRLVKASS
jgi:formylglycine-generating enzyme required for sulfatase activity